MYVTEKKSNVKIEQNYYKTSNWGVKFASFWLRISDHFFK